MLNKSRIRYCNREDCGRSGFSALVEGDDGAKMELIFRNEVGDVWNCIVFIGGVKPIAEVMHVINYDHCNDCLVDEVLRKMRNVYSDVDSKRDKLGKFFG